MKLKKTSTGLKFGEFKDFNGDACSIQESSSLNQPLIWLGMQRGTHHFQGGCMARMHLTKRHAKQLISHLQKFLNTGHL